MIDLPKNPKAEDLLPILEDLDRRVAALEEQAVRGDNRVGALEMYAAMVIAERGRQIDDLRATAEQRQTEVNDLRWAVTRGRRTTRR